MSTETDQRSEAPAAEEPQGPVAGERLAEARREQQISVVEIAKELHLDESKVRALERNEFDQLGAAVYAKGHLKKYAELVGVEVDDVLTDYYQLVRSERVPPLVFERPKVRREISPGPWIAIVILAVFIAAVYWWFVGREPVLVSPLPEPPVDEAGLSAEMPDDEHAGEQAVEPAADSSSVQLDAGEGSGSAPAEAQPPAVESAATAAANTEGRAALPATEPAPEDEPAEATELRLTISFTGDCWTEISDAAGRRLYFGMGRAGQAVDLVGAAPVSLLFGNAANVALFVDGAEYALPSDAPNRTIRLTLFEPD